jgi:hypothetical protein
MPAPMRIYRPQMRMVDAATPQQDFKSYLDRLSL